jgi:cyclopropane fatty-acyl-phospholipid synthase-like methyltransferase
MPLLSRFSLLKLSNIKKTLSNFFYRKKSNNVKYQKHYWKDQLLNNKNCHYRFDRPICQNKELGDYEKIKKKYFLPQIKGKRVLEIGCLGGRWSKFFFGIARKIYLVDLSSYAGVFLKREFPNEKFEFYKTKGYELKGIKADSIDFVFSIDSLVRAPKNYIYKYFNEIARILSPNGKVLIHLPCQDMPDSRNRGFTDLTKKEIFFFSEKAGLKNVHIDQNLIKHGVILMVNYNSRYNET